MRDLREGPPWGWTCTVRRTDLQPHVGGEIKTCHLAGSVATFLFEAGRHCDRAGDSRPRPTSPGWCPARNLRCSRSRRSHCIDLLWRVVLARTGALDGLKATTHWLAVGELARRYPAVDVNPDVLYVDNGKVLTSAGAAAAFDLCLHLVRRDFGAEIAAQAARAAVMPLERAGGQAQFITYQQPVAADPMSIGSLLFWIEQNLRGELSLPRVARRAAMSIRTLSRRFREQVGASPAQWISGARVRSAQRLLETTGLSVEEVATEAGFGSASVLREHFGRIVGTSPIAYRRAFSGGEQ